MNTKEFSAQHVQHGKMLKRKTTIIILSLLTLVLLAVSTIVFFGERKGAKGDEEPYIKPEEYHIKNEGLSIKNSPRIIFEKEISKEKKTQRIHDALVLATGDYFKKMGFKKAILGLSGGIDSAVTLALAVKALGKENVKAILMPSQFSSDHSISDAEQLVKNLNVSFETIHIEDIFNVYIEKLKDIFNDKPADITEENIQARTRAVILMALANKFGYILLNTSNKSEAAVGYGTLYGDMCGGLSILGDVYKTEVYDLAGLINKHEEIIPASTITKPPSAELRPEQKDTDELPEYGILDEILCQYIEGKKSPDEIIAKGFDEQLVRKIMELVNTNEYKRYQAPPILRVSPKAFGMGRRMPIVGKYLS